MDAVDEVLMWIDCAKLFLFLFDGNVGFRMRNGRRIMGTNFLGELIAKFSMQDAHGSLLFQALVGDLVPNEEVLALLINQLGHGRAMIGL